MNDTEQSMWKGGNEPASFPHLCPFRPSGASAAECIELSGTNYHYNEHGCCGTHRGTVRFVACNSLKRRCIICLQIGRRGAQANAVTDVVTGRCSEHMSGATEMPVRIESERTELVTRTSVPSS